MKTTLISDISPHHEITDKPNKGINLLNEEVIEKHLDKLDTLLKATHPKDVVEWVKDNHDIVEPMSGLQLQLEDNESAYLCLGSGKSKVFTEPQFICKGGMLKALDAYLISPLMNFTILITDQSNNVVTTWSIVTSKLNGRLKRNYVKASGMRLDEYGTYQIGTSLVRLNHHLRPRIADVRGKYVSCVKRLYKPTMFDVTIYDRGIPEQQPLVTDLTKLDLGFNPIFNQVHFFKSVKNEARISIADDPSKVYIYNLDNVYCNNISYVEGELHYLVQMHRFEECLELIDEIKGSGTSPIPTIYYRLLQTLGYKDILSRLRTLCTCKHMKLPYPKNKRLIRMALRIGLFVYDKENNEMTYVPGSPFTKHLDEKETN